MVVRSELCPQSLKLKAILIGRSWFSIASPFDRRNDGIYLGDCGNLILRLMEDPDERDRRMRDQLYKTKAAGKKFVDDFSLPIRPYGFWTFERHNAQLRWDPQISHAAGRRDPYDEVL